MLLGGKNVPLPRPALQVAEMPALVPTVISAGGQRLLLSDTDVEVCYDSASKSLVVNPPGWWVINYPFTRIQGLEGKSADQISQLLFGAAREVRNWYVKTPEESELVPEPAAPTQPAPIELTGVYREAVEIEQSGTAKNSVRLEGVRDRNGQMPFLRRLNEQRHWRDTVLCKFVVRLISESSRSAAW